MEDVGLALMGEWINIAVNFKINLVKIMKQNKENERIVLPLMNVVKFLSNQIDEKFFNEIQELISNEMKTNFGSIFKQLTYLSLY
jgi:hypothetical protein